MYEYTIWNEKTQELDSIFGYSDGDAFRRRPDLDRKEWKVLLCDYID